MKIKNSGIILVIIFCSNIVSAQKDSILIKEPFFTYEVVEPVYETYTYDFLVRDSVPSNYKLEIVTESVLIKEAAFTYQVIPPLYEIVIDTIVKGGKTMIIEKEVLEVGVPTTNVRTIEVPAEYRVVTKSVICCPDGGAGTVISSPVMLPRLYETITIQRLKIPAKLIKVEIPAKYYYY